MKISGATQMVGLLGFLWGYGHEDVMLRKLQFRPVNRFELTRHAGTAKRSTTSDLLDFYHPIESGRFVR